MKSQKNEIDAKTKKKAFTSLKLVSEIESEIEERKKELTADIGIFTEEDAKEVRETGIEKVIKSEKNGIPDAVLTVEKANKVLLNRQNLRSKRINQCMEVIGDVLDANNCKLQGSLIVDDAVFGKISRMRPFAPNGILTLNIEQDKIIILHKE